MYNKKFLSYRIFSSWIRIRITTYADPYHWRRRLLFCGSGAREKGILKVNFFLVTRNHFLFVRQFCCFVVIVCWAGICEQAGCSPSFSPYLHRQDARPCLKLYMGGEEGEGPAWQPVCCWMDLDLDIPFLFYSNLVFLSGQYFIYTVFQIRIHYHPDSGLSLAPFRSGSKG